MGKGGGKGSERLGGEGKEEDWRKAADIHGFSCSTENEEVRREGVTTLEVLSVERGEKVLEWLHELFISSFFKIVLLGTRGVGFFFL